MRVSGFTFVRNAVRLDYPIVESIQSILPIVDEFVVNVGDSDDGTLDLIRSIDSRKLRIVESTWNPNVRTGGYVLAQQTNIALFNCTGEWAIYLQADESIHEQDHARLVELMRQYRADDRVEGLLLQRLPFVGDYRTVFAHPYYCDLACRVVKPHRFVLSRGDAAGFTVHPKYKERGRKLRSVDTGLTLFHYSDVRAPAQSASSLKERTQYWNLRSEIPITDFYQHFPRRFMMAYEGDHPAPMRGRFARMPASLSIDSPDWRSTMTAHERRHYWRARAISLVGGPRLLQRMTCNDRIVASHRTGYVGQKA